MTHPSPENSCQGRGQIPAEGGLPRNHQEGTTMHDVRGPADDSPVTLINVFEVPAGHVDEFIAGWRERAALMSTKPGFRDTRLHRALSAQSRFPLVNVAHWESRAALHAAQADPGFQELIKAATTDPRAPVSANPAVYEIAVEFSSPTPPDTAAPRPSTGPALPAHTGQGRRQMCSEAGQQH